MNFKTNEDGGWIVPANSDLTGIVVFPDFSEFGIGCKFGNWCNFGNGCKFGNYCKFGSGCKINNYTVNRFLTLANVDGSGRQVLMIWHDTGVYIEAGCFTGSLEEFCAKAESEGKHRYITVIKAVAFVG